MAGQCGQTINPYSVAFSGARTASEFSTNQFRVELRRGVYNGALWVWIRSTVLSGSNYQWGSTVELNTPCGTVKGLPYGSGDNWDVGASRCSPAICLGTPVSYTTVVFSGAASGSNASKTARVI